MEKPTDHTELNVIVLRNHTMMAIVLNRPDSINSLTLNMVRTMRNALEEAEAEKQFRFVLLYGYGVKGFCAGGDIKTLAHTVMTKSNPPVGTFLEEEYNLCLKIHNFPKPVIAMVHGITMGGGLGLCAGADIVIAADDTRIAMPETKIGFFPDVGATGWMFTKCPAGYPEYLGLTGHEIPGSEAVRLGLASRLVRRNQMDKTIALVQNFYGNPACDRKQAATEIIAPLNSLLINNIPQKPETDDWVAEHFAGKTSVKDIIDSLRKCRNQSVLCAEVFQNLPERSPTALALTLKLLRYNEQRPLKDVFKTELKAAVFMMHHPDFLEGVRARIFDKDDNPAWQPATIEEVEDLDIDL